ncbi:hypothetical protein ABL840_04915 [Variovorax sp. NFACC27]|nr:hypothetical protein SAMN03159371_00117 [Variovorax sp. NFACC28]SEF72536.1 hypothetical protein SAMN03159365_00700 [Variovorax sp. NFACC29]SFB77278.1 hypothetical protein SAMN03159379_00699 [Variovorax sp. NFACC26]SFG76887.1 hypothetical protein SAMN03159447_04822 [Variovorax sp. NFACC27]
MATTRKRDTTKRTEASTPTTETGDSSPPKRRAAKQLQEQPVRPRVPEGVPHIYADLVMDAVYGIHTTKVVLAEETGAGLEGIRPVGVVVMPTSTLLEFARRLIQDLTHPGIAQETAKRYALILQSMSQEKPDASPS